MHRDAIKILSFILEKACASARTHTHITVNLYYDHGTLCITHTLQSPTLTISSERTFALYPLVFIPLCAC